MYKYSVSTYINEQKNYQDDFIFGINLKTGTKFKLLNCYISFDRGNKGKESELITIDYFSEDENIQEIKKNIERSVHVLSYLLAFPIDDYSSVYKEDIGDAYEVEVTQDYKKINHIDFINNKILGLDDKLESLFYHNIKLIHIGQKYNFAYGFTEDAFINFFKILENIAAFKYSNNTKKYRLDVSSYNLDLKIKEILEDSLGIEYSEAQIENITNNVASTICKNATTSAFFKISIFCKENNIPVNAQVLHEAIKVRNKIAHGDCIREEDIDNVHIDICKLAYNFIAYNFFNENYTTITIPSDIRTYE